MASFLFTPEGKTSACLTCWERKTFLYLFTNEKSTSDGSRDILPPEQIDLFIFLW